MKLTPRHPAFTSSLVLLLGLALGAGDPATDPTLQRTPLTPSFSQPLGGGAPADAKRQPNLKNALVTRMPLRPLPADGKTGRSVELAVPGRPALSATRECPAGQAFAQAQARVDAATRPSEREPALLDLAATYVGLGDWASARDIYEHLLAVSALEPVRVAAERNLLVVRQQLAVLAEPDAQKRDELTWELAELHFALGHPQAGERLLKALALDAQDQALRREATERLKQFGKRPGPPRVPGDEDRQVERQEPK